MANTLRSQLEDQTIEYGMATMQAMLHRVSVPRPVSYQLFSSQPMIMIEIGYNITMDLKPGQATVNNARIISGRVMALIRLGQSHVHGNVSSD